MDGGTYMINRIKEAFTDPFAMTPSKLDRLFAIYWRLRGCDHDGDFCLDVGDEEHIYQYCFRCHRRV